MPAPRAMAAYPPARTLLDRLWQDHLIAHLDERTDLLQVDRHVVHEVSSPEAFRQLREKGRKVAFPEQTFATQDHILSTRPGRDDQTFAGGTEFIRFLRRNCDENGIRLFDLGDPRQGIVHVVAAELGLALPGSTLVCGDSHTATLGAFGALAFGVGTSEVAHVLATQTIGQARPQALGIRVTGRLGASVVAKDLILAILGRYGIGAGVGHAIEYAGPAIRALDMEGRMTVCNMSIELGARFGMIAPDDTTFEYLHGRAYAPRDGAWDAAIAQWRRLRSDDEARFDKVLELDVTGLKPQVTWGTTPGDVIAVDEPVPALDAVPAARRSGYASALSYMGLAPGQRLDATPIDYVFIGSCTNSRLGDLRAAAALARGRKVAPGVRALVVPGSTPVRRAAEREGLDRIFTAAGFEWREAGCSMCLGINDDVVPPGKRCVSTSNRNFEGRQGPDARTHLASPLTAAASAIAGRIADPSLLAP